MIEKIRFFVRWNGEAIGLMVVFSVSVIAALVIAGLVYSDDEGQDVIGTVTGFGMREDYTGSYRVMNVETGQSRDTISAPYYLNCRVGDEIKLTRIRHWWGHRHLPRSGDGDMCSKQPFSQQS